MNCQIEISINNNSIVTSRSLKITSPSNSYLQLYNIEKELIKSKKKLIKLKIRFDIS